MQKAIIVKDKEITCDENKNINKQNLKQKQHVLIINARVKQNKLNSQRRTCLNQQDALVKGMI